GRARRGPTARTSRPARARARRSRPRGPSPWVVRAHRVGRHLNPGIVATNEGSGGATTRIVATNHDVGICNRGCAGLTGVIAYSHSIVPGGFDVMSNTTRLTPFTSLT